jgi:hypothetical protein
VTGNKAFNFEGWDNYSGRRAWTPSWSVWARQRHEVIDARRHRRGSILGDWNANTLISRPRPCSAMLYPRRRTYHRSAGRGDRGGDSATRQRKGGNDLMYGGNAGRARLIRLGPRHWPINEQPRRLDFRNSAPPAVSVAQVGIDTVITANESPLGSMPPPSTGRFIFA